jgi:hypothetical protein
MGAGRELGAYIVATGETIGRKENAMNKKDYVVIARALCEHVSRAAERLEVAQDLAEHFAADNPHFDRARFMVAVFADQSSDQASRDARARSGGRL